MNRKQTRRCISISAETWTRLKVYTEAHGIPASQIAEAALAPVLRGEVRIAAGVSPGVLAHQRHQARRGVTPVIVPADPEIARDMARMAAANIVVGLGPKEMQLSAETEQLVRDQAERTGAEPDVVLDRAVGRMLNELEAYPESWCRKCCETAERCACRARRSA